MFMSTKELARGVLRDLAGRAADDDEKDMAGSARALIGDHVKYKALFVGYDPLRLEIGIAAGRGEKPALMSACTHAMAGANWHAMFDAIIFLGHKELAWYAGTVMAHHGARPLGFLSYIVAGRTDQARTVLPDSGVHGRICDAIGAKDTTALETLFREAWADGAGSLELAVAIAAAAQIIASGT